MGITSYCNADFHPWSTIPYLNELFIIKLYINTEGNDLYVADRINNGHPSGGFGISLWMSLICLLSEIVREKDMHTSGNKSVLYIQIKPDIYNGNFGKALEFE